MLVPCHLTAQAAPRDTTRVLVFEHRFGPDAGGQDTVRLRRGIVYRAEVEGTATPVIVGIGGAARETFVVPIDTISATRRFEIYALQNGLHRVGVNPQTTGTITTLRLYMDSSETRRIAEKRDRALAIGVLLSGGIHSGYRFDPTGGENPAGGSDVEGCLLAEGTRFGACIGAGRESMPDASFAVTWLFLEGRGRVWSGYLWGERRTDVGATLRYSQALNAGPRALSPGLLGVGLFVSQNLTATRYRRGLRAVLAWQHGRLGNAPETERLDTDRLTAGIAWLP